MTGPWFTVMVERHNRSGSVDWPRGELYLDSDAGLMHFQYPYVTPDIILPRRIAARQVLDVQIVGVGDQAVRLISFFVLLAIPVALSPWLPNTDWDVGLTVMFVGLDLITSWLIGRWLTIPAIQITLPVGQVRLMATGWRSPERTRMLAVALSEMLASQGYRGPLPPLNDQFRWQVIHTRIVISLIAVTVILILTAISFSISQLLVVMAK